jgi:hypothetical protein
MSQSNYNIPNQSAPNVRAQLNAVFGSIATNNSGSTAPSTTFAYQWWYDTSTDILKQRNAANSAWINIGTFDQSGGVFQVLDDTPVVTAGGAAAGLLGDQATATWEAGTSTTESLVSPAKVKAAVEALAPPPPDATILLGTINTTSGSTQTITGLSLAPYKFLFAIFNGVTHSEPELIRSISFAGVQVSNTTGNAQNGLIQIDLNTGRGAAVINASALGANFGVTDATTSISVSTSGAFSAGSVRLYGAK